jgi:hypothetical protein
VRRRRRRRIAGAGGGDTRFERGAKNFPTLKAHRECSLIPLVEQHLREDKALGTEVKCQRFLVNII